MTLQLHQPDGRGGLQPRSEDPRGWRAQLRSPRWGSGRRGGQLPALRNPEMNPTSTLRSALFWIGLALLTFVLLVAGYGTGFWHLA